MINELRRLPKYTVTKIELTQSPCCIGFFDSKILLKDGWIGFIVTQEGSCIKGRIFNYTINTNEAEFRPANLEQIQLIVIDEIYAYLDGYWGSLVALVLNKSYQWRRQAFVAQEAMEYDSGEFKITGKVGQSPSFHTESDGRSIPRGWNHEHCYICQEEISETAQRLGYVNQNNNWVCENCFLRFIQTKRLGFLNDRAISQIIGLDTK